MSKVLLTAQSSYLKQQGGGDKVANEINQDAIDAVGVSIGGLMKDWKDDLSDAYQKAAGAFKVNVTITFGASKNGGLEIKTNLGFNQSEKIQDTAVVVIGEQQQSIPGMDE